jgi:hypothetical protein
MAMWESTFLRKRQRSANALDACWSAKRFDKSCKTRFIAKLAEIGEVKSVDGRIGHGKRGSDRQNEAFQSPYGQMANLRAMRKSVALIEHPRTHRRFIREHQFR